VLTFAGIGHPPSPRLSSLRGAYLGLLLRRREGQHLDRRPDDDPRSRSSAAPHHRRV